MSPQRGPRWRSARRWCVAGCCARVLGPLAWAGALHALNTSYTSRLNAACPTSAGGYAAAPHRACVPPGAGCIGRLQIYDNPLWYGLMCVAQSSATYNGLEQKVSVDLRGLGSGSARRRGGTRAARGCHTQPPSPPPPLRTASRCDLPKGHRCCGVCTCALWHVHRGYGRARGAAVTQLYWCA